MAYTNLPQIVTEPLSACPTGERLIPAHACLYPPAIDSHDLLLVDFDRHKVKYGALYLVEEVRDGKVLWMGCRRFDLMPDGIKIDVSGEGDWRDFSGYAADVWRIAGEVKEVFKPSIAKQVLEVCHG